MTQYAPYPGAMAADIWPLSMSEMTDQLIQTQNPRPMSKPPSPSLVGSSPYDNRAEAAAGAAALVKAQQRPQPSRITTEPTHGRPRMNRMSMPQPFRSASLPTTANEPVSNGSYLPNGSSQSPSTLAFRQQPNMINTQRLPSVQSPELPCVVLTPPDGESKLAGHV